MSKLIPQQVVDVVKTFNDLAIGLVGIDCTLYIPTNLTAIESEDMYVCPTEDITYRRWNDQLVWIEWFAKDIVRLRKLGIFTENEIPILARFKNDPEVIMGSYIKVPIKYIPEKYNTDEFEVIDVIVNNTYDNEIYRWYKLAARRAKVQDKT